MPKLVTSYEENLPTQNWKTRRFRREIVEEIPSETFRDKEKFLSIADRQQKMCETLVKGDIERHIEELKKMEE